MNPSRRLAIALLPLTILAALGVASCSSAPDPPEEVYERQNQGATFADYGNAYFAEGQYARALDFFSMALNEHRAVDNEPGICRSLNSIGSVYLAAGRLQAADRAFSDALAVAEKLDDAGLGALSHNNIGELALRRGNNEKAEESFHTALSFVPDDEPERKAIVRHNLGVALMRQSRFQEAETSLREALAINEAERRKAEAAANWYMLASIRAQQDDYATATEYVLRALELDKQMENSLGIAKDLRALGTIHAKMEELPAALDYTRRALEVYVALNMAEESIATLAELERLSIRAGNEEEAELYRGQRERIEQR